ncbi:MAG: hypothetical protein RLY93_16235 [Sumerlaeia bacterium]
MTSTDGHSNGNGREYLPPVAFYENDYLRHDLRGGTLFNRSGTKMCYMPSELLIGLQRTLEDETGPAWRLILKRVGQIWGRRVARRFRQEMQEFYGRPLFDLPMREFTTLLEAYFRYHGWGLLTLDFTHANSGLIAAKLENSAFVEVIGNSDVPIDSIVSGLLAELVSEVAERDDIECFETECSAMGAPCCRFILGIKGRIGKVPDWVEEGLSHEEVLERLNSPVEDSATA